MNKCKICGGKLTRWYKGLFDDRHGYPGKFDVKKCKKCGFGQTIPQLSASKIARIYSQYYPWKEVNISKVEKKDYIVGDRFKLWRKGLLMNGQYLVRPKSTVLDVGCGLGYSLLELESMKCKAYGIDPDKNAFKLAKKFKLNFKVGFITDNPFKNIKFDYVLANQVLEHTNKPSEFIKACAKKLTDEGKIILSFPNTNSLTRYLLKRNWLHWHIPYHLNFFNKKSIEIIAKKNNLRIESLKTVTPNMWTNLQIRRSLQKPVVGKRDEFWDGKGEKSDSILKIGWVTKAVMFFEEYNFLNRIIDVFGYGESYVLTLVKDTPRT